MARTSLQLTPLRGPRRAGLWLAVLALAASVAGCATPDNNAPGESVDQRPSPQAGSQLVYRTLNAYNHEQRSVTVQRFTAEGSRIEGIDYDEAASTGFSRPIARLVARQLNSDGDTVAWDRADGMRTTFDPPLRTLPFPLVPGRTTRQDVFARDGDNPRPRRVIMIVRVGGWETVKVPAGEFRALRVTRDLYMGDFQPSRTETRRSEIDWYAPAAGAIVRSSEDSEYQDTLMGRSQGGRAMSRRGDWLLRELTSRVDAVSSR
jgi:hypothetical protein